MILIFQVCFMLIKTLSIDIDNDEIALKIIRMFFQREYSTLSVILCDDSVIEKIVQEPQEHTVLYFIGTLLAKDRYYYNRYFEFIS